MDTLCAIDRAILKVGDRATLMLLREMALGGRRFHDLQVQTRLAPGMVAQRLKAMEADGLVERRLYNERPRRYEYLPTEKARELDLVLLGLHRWGLRWTDLPPGAPPAVRLSRRSDGAPSPPLAQDFRFQDYEPLFSEAFAEERRARRRRAAL